MQFRWIPAGCVVMGEPAAGSSDDGFRLPLPDANEVPARRVCVAGFWIGVTEVTVGQWRRAFPSARQGTGSGDSIPVSAVGWNEARRFARRVSELDPGRSYRLPTEAEWEYACWASNRSPPRSTRLHGQERQAAALALGERAVFGDPGVTDPKPAPVASRAANEFGLHDMLGNLWEWVEDSYLPDAYRARSESSPLVRASTRDHVLRGGSYKSQFDLVRCGARSFADEDELSPVIGFRLVVDKEQGR